MVFFCFFFLCRYSGWHQAVYAGADSHYTEGFAVPVLEDESSGSSCHGINCQTDRLPCTSTSGNSAVCTAAGPARENMDWEGKKGTVTLRALVQLLVLEAESAVFFVREDDIQEITFREPSVWPALSGYKSSTFQVQNRALINPCVVGDVPSSPVYQYLCNISQTWWESTVPPSLVSFADLEFCFTSF